MNRFLYCLAIVLLTAAIYAQPIPKIKILLLGTFHFGETGDKGKTAFNDLFSAKRQQEIQQLINQLARLKPDKIFVENEPDRQVHWDSLYNQYQQGTLDTSALQNEIFQIAMRTAKKSGPFAGCLRRPPATSPLRQTGGFRSAHQ